MKAEQKAKEKAEKEANKAIAAAAAATATVNANTTNSSKIQSKELEDISPNEYFKLRSAAIAELKKSPETDPYPHKFHVSISLENFINKYNHLKEGEMLENDALR